MKNPSTLILRVSDQVETIEPASGPGAWRRQEDSGPRTANTTESRPERVTPGRFQAIPEPANWTTEASRSV